MLAIELGLTKEQREFAAPNYHSEGNRKWRNEIQFVKDKLKNKNEIDASRRDYWKVSTAGYLRLGLTPPPSNQ